MIFGSGFMGLFYVGQKKKFVAGIGCLAVFAMKVSGKREWRNDLPRIEVIHKNFCACRRICNIQFRPPNESQEGIPRAGGTTMRDLSKHRFGDWTLKTIGNFAHLDV